MQNIRKIKAEFGDTNNQFLRQKMKEVKVENENLLNMIDSLRTDNPASKDSISDQAQQVQNKLGDIVNYCLFKWQR